MALLDGQWSYNGFTFGAGCAVLVNRVDGFEGFEARTGDSDNPRGDGGIRGMDYVAPRTVSFELNAWEPDLDGSTYEALYATVRAAFAPSRTADAPLVFKRPGQPERVVYGRPVSLGRSEAWDHFGRYGYPPVVVRCVDPRIYATAARSGNVAPFAAAPGGVDFGADFGIEFTGGTQVEFVATNAGTANAYPLVRFFGPVTGTVTGVKLTNSTTGDVLQVVTTMTTGQILTCDMTAAVTASNSLVVSLDGSSRYGSWQLPRTAFPLAPGSNTLRFEITGTSTDAACSVSWSDTWMN